MPPIPILNHTTEQGSLKQEKKIATTNIFSSGFRGITNDELFVSILRMISPIHETEVDVTFFLTKNDRKSLTDPTGDLIVNLKVQNSYRIYQKRNL